MTEFFDTAFVIIDEHARPIVIIPQDLPDGDAFITIVPGGIDIGVGNDTYGKIRDMDDTQLALFALHPKIGMATYKGDENEPMPDTIAYVANVTDTRFKEGLTS